MKSTHVSRGISPTSAQSTSSNSTASPIQKIEEQQWSQSASPGSFSSAQLFRLQRTIGNGATAKLMNGSAPIQRMEDDEIAELSRSDKKIFDALKKKYHTKLGPSSPLYKFHEGYVEDLVKAASGLKDLEDRINTAIAKAEKRMEAASHVKEAAPSPVTPPSVAEESKSSASDSASIPSTSAASPSVPSGKKKKARRDVTADFFTGGPAKKQEAVSVGNKADNKLIKDWIKAKPASATIAKGAIDVSADTVYIYATVTIPDSSMGYQQLNTYNIEVHYHPVPTSANFLHVKHSAGSDAGNKISSDSWLIPGGKATLKQAVAQWDSAYPDNKSPHTW